MPGPMEQVAAGQVYFYSLVLNCSLVRAKDRGEGASLAAPVSEARASPCIFSVRRK